MNNLQHIVKDGTRYAMHVAVELCEQGDFDSVTDAFRWLMQERDDSELGSETCENTQHDADFMCSVCGKCVDNGRILGFNFCPNCGKRIRKAVER